MSKVDNESLIDLGKASCLFFNSEKNCQYFYILELLIQNNSLKIKIALRVISN